MSATNWNINSPRCKAKNHWHSIDADSQKGAVTVLLCLLPWQAANTSVMHHNNQIAIELMYFHDHTSLTLRWHSFEPTVLSLLTAIDNYFDYDLNLLLPIWQMQSLLCSRVECSNLLALFTLILLKFIYLAKRFIAPAIHLFISQYSKTTDCHLPIIDL